MDNKKETKAANQKNHEKQQEKEPEATSLDETKAANLREILAQQWEHARHIEDERTWYLVSYFIGIGTLLGQTANKLSDYKWLLPVLIIPTVVGLVLSIRWSDAFDQHKDRVNALVALLGFKPIIVEGKEVRFDMKIEASPFFSLFRTKSWYYFFYGSILIVLVVGSIAIFATN